MLTKKEFKNQISYHEYGKGREKTKAIFFDKKCDLDNNAVGFKYMYSCSNGLTKNELINEAYDWIFNEKNPSWYCIYAIAHKEHQRFKVPLITSDLFNISNKIALDMQKSLVV